jgi:hypothetical protein
MEKIPTRLWAATIGLCDTPLCRHCDSVLEDITHWFFNCPSLNYASFLIYNFESLADISTALRSTESFEIENAVLHFIKFNDLFQIPNAITADGTIPEPTKTAKRKLDVSPSPSRDRKPKKARQLSSRERKRNTYDFILDPNENPSPKRRFMGPAQFIRAMDRNK